MAELRVKDYKPAKHGAWHFAQVKKGNRLYGEVRKYPDGTTIYWAFRKPDEVFSELDAWAVDVETINALRVRKVGYVGILVTNGDIYVTAAENFIDKDLGAKVLNYHNHTGVAPGAKGKRGALQWYLPRYAFSKKIAPGDGTLALMRIKGR